MLALIMEMRTRISIAWVFQRNDPERIQSCSEGKSRLHKRIIDLVIVSLTKEVSLPANHCRLMHVKGVCPRNFKLRKCVPNELNQRTKHQWGFCSTAT